MRNLLKALVRADGGGLFEKAMSAGFWAAALRVVLRASIIVRTIILARLLAPDDFGLMAIATLSILLVERLTQGGIDSALVQQSGDIRPYLNTAWTLQIVRGLLMAAALFTTAPWIAQFFGVPMARQVIQVLSISVAMKGFVNIGVVSFVKELRFDRYFVLQMADRGVDIVVSIIAAFVLRNVWALVLGVLAGSLGRLIVSYVVHEFRPRLQWVWSQVKQLFHFGKWILVSNILNYVAGNIDDIIVGRVLGVQSLGWYRMAYNFSQAVATEVTQVANQVAFPTYSKLQGSLDRLRVAYMGSLHLVSFIGFPLAIGTILVAPDFVLGLLGGKWAPMVVPLQFLAVAGLMRGLGATIGPLFQSQGRPDIPPRFSLALMTLLAIFVYPGVQSNGMEGVAAVVAVAGTITGGAALVAGLRMVKASAGEIVQSVAFPALNASLMVPFVLLAGVVFTSETAFSFLALSLTGVAAYAGAVILSTRFLPYGAPASLIERVRRAVA